MEEPSTASNADIDSDPNFGIGSAAEVASLSAQILCYFLDLGAGQPKDQRPHEPCLAIVTDAITNIDSLVHKIGFILAGKDRIAVPYRHASVDAMADRTFVLAIKGFTIEQP